MTSKPASLHVDKPWGSFDQYVLLSLIHIYSRTSWVIFIEQNFGPHIEQKCATLWASFGRVSSW